MDRGRENEMVEKDGKVQYAYLIATMGKTGRVYREIGDENGLQQRIVFSIDLFKEEKKKHRISHNTPEAKMGEHGY